MLGLHDPLLNELFSGNCQKQLIEQIRDKEPVVSLRVLEASSSWPPPSYVHGRASADIRVLLPLFRACASPMSERTPSLSLSREEIRRERNMVICGLAIVR